MQKYRAFTLIELFVVVLIVGLMIIWLLPRTSPSREPARSAECASRMKKIGIALRQYHDTYGTFPPACTVDKEGTSLQSWRTLILPNLLLEESEPPIEGIRLIRLDEPWDSEENTTFHLKMVRVLQCPSAPHHRGTTIYKMITGEKTAAGTSMSTWKRKPSEVVLLIEAWPPVPWMSPNDFSLEDFSTTIYPTDLEERNPEKKKYSVDDRNPDKKPIIGAYHPKEFHVLFADGTVKTYKNWKLPISDLEKMCRTE